MTVIYEGGPHDGLKLDAAHWRRDLIILRMPGRGLVRRFTFLPGVADLAGVLAGEMSVIYSPEYHFYELTRVHRGAWVARSVPAGPSP